MRKKSNTLDSLLGTFGSSLKFGSEFLYFRLFKIVVMIFYIRKIQVNIDKQKSLVSNITRLFDTSGAEGGNRTPTSISSTDFESVASTSSTTSAKERRKIN